MQVALHAIRLQIEEGFEVTGAVDDEVRSVAARN
jgi:shikimate kinase